MNPRVNIAYSIELDNIPKEVSLLIERVAVRLMKLPDEVQASYRSLNAGHTNIQEELEKIHTKITESSVQSEAYYSGVNSSMGELLDRIDKLYMVVLGKSRW